MAYNIVERLTGGESAQRNVVEIYNASTALDDGFVGILGALATGEDRLRSLDQAADVTAEEVVMVLGMKDFLEDSSGMRNDAVTDPTSIIYPAGKPLRAYRLKIGDRYVLSNTAINGTAVADEYLVPANAAWLVVPAANLTGATKVAFKVLKVNEKLYKGNSEVAATLVEVVVQA